MLRADLDWSVFLLLYPSYDCPCYQLPDVADGFWFLHSCNVIHDGLKGGRGRSISDNRKLNERTFGSVLNWWCSGCSMARGPDTAVPQQGTRRQGQSLPSHPPI